jgi:lipoprotein-releasing system ATP-binding protein
MLVLKNIHKSFIHNGNVINVLNGINIQLDKGDNLAIMGASGVGKSTLLNIMGTLEPPSSGEVIFKQLDVNKMDESEICLLRNHEIGFVFQFHHLLPEFNALENTIMPALIARRDKNESITRAERVLNDMGLGKRLNHRIGELSGGEQQRVAIARALMMKPDLLLADEPTGNLDRITGEETVDLLLRMGKEQGLSMVIATHNQRIAGKMTKVMEIVDGKIQYSV